MIYNTIVPEEQVFAGYESFEPKYMTVNMAGCEMLVEPFGTDQARIVRLYSPNPQHYLLPQWTPGTVIQLAWTPAENN
jgi:hypothetical protein